MGIAGGLLTGFIASLSFFEAPIVLFDDRDNFNDCVYPKENENHAPDTNTIDNPHGDRLNEVKDGYEHQEVEMRDLKK